MAYRAALGPRAHFPREAAARAGGAGRAGHGGARGRTAAPACDYMSLALAIEEIAAGDGSTSTIVSVQNSVVCGPIARVRQRRAERRVSASRWRAASMLGCFCLTEPQVGSDAAAITTRAEREGDHYVLNGIKQFITSGKNADMAIVFAVTDKAAGKNGISAFIVATAHARLRRRADRGQSSDSARPTPRRSCSKIASPARPTCWARRARVTGSRWPISRRGRIGIAAQAVGMARAAFDAALAYARERESLRQADHRASGGEFPARRHGDRRSRSRGRWCWHAASLRDAGLPCLKEASMAKLFASEMAERVCSDAIQIHGGYGYVERFSGRAHLPRRARVPDLRGHERHPAHGHRPRARRRSVGDFDKAADRFDVDPHVAYGSRGRDEPLLTTPWARGPYGS